MIRFGPFQVEAYYRQFYLQDFREFGDPGSGEFWTDEAFDSRLAEEVYVLGVATDTDGEVPVTLEVWESEPESAQAVWDHIVEASLESTAGDLKLAGCPDGDVRFQTIPVTAGWYRVRVHSAGLTRSPREFVYNGDSYLVQIWPAPRAARLLLKRFHASSAET